MPAALIGSVWHCLVSGLIVTINPARDRRVEKIHAWAGGIAGGGTMSVLLNLWARWWMMAVGIMLLGLLFLAGPMGWDAPSRKPAALPALAAQLHGTTVSGISSGAYMAGQFQLAHADIVSGAGIIAGGPYACAESAFAGVVPDSGTVFLNASRAVNGCMLNALAMWGIPDPALLAGKARTFSNENKIGAIADVTTDRLYLFSGQEDTVVKPPIVAAAVAFYRNLGVPDGNILYVSDVPAGHAFVTTDSGGECSVSRSPYITDCDYDQAGVMLKQILGQLAPPQEQLAGRFLEFDQDPFTENIYDHGMGPSGVVFIPDSCRDEAGCRLHVAFHGCLQNRAAVGDAFIKESGLARWAASNRLIVLFPEVSTGALNPQGCWDWWGYTGRQYLTRDAAQIRAVRAMLDRLAGPAASASL